MKYFGKPGLVIALEASDGGGVSSIQEFDCPYVQPNSYQEFTRLITELQTDTEFGAVIVDNATDMVQRIIKPHALTFPVRGQAPPTRSVGVPHRDDYQVMGELCRQLLNQIINLTKLTNVNARKHVLVTVLEKDKSDDNGMLVSTCPDLPGAMADTASAMFELYAGIKIGSVVEADPSNPKVTRKRQTRSLITKPEGKRVLGDRYKVFPDEGPLDFVELFEKYWMPKSEASRLAMATSV
jgi:hypothetical protein